METVVKLIAVSEKIQLCVKIAITMFSVNETLHDDTRIYKLNN